jgi:hypothetical protein
MPGKSEGKINVPNFELEQVVPEGDENVFQINEETPADNNFKKPEESIDKGKGPEVPDNPEQEQVTIRDVKEKK